jgi:transglutaminase-like putative cysteine protease
MPHDKEPSKTLATDIRQSIGNIKDQSFDLTVTAVRQPPTVMAAGVVNPGKEYTESNFFLTSDDPVVKQHAAEAVGTETDPWRKAQLVERWVNQHMKVQNFTEAMAPASEVAKTLTGDCTEYSMLAAAMCKAAGLPARTAIGLVYVDFQPPELPILGFHMWTEVYVRGQWTAIDATLGKGSVGPAHVKITDAHWHDTRSMTPLLPLMRVMISRPTVQIVQVK